MEIKKQKKYIRKVLEMAKENGYQSFEYTGKDFAYGYVITPDNNLLCIGRSESGYGFFISFLYVPSKKNGSGCSCHNKESIGNIENSEILKKLEKQGLCSARNFGAILYTKQEVEEYLDKRYENRDEIKRL